MATETIRIELASTLKEFVEARAAQAGYSSIADYVQGLIRADQKQHLDRLEHEVLKGLRSGESIPMTSDDWDELRRRVRERQCSGSAHRENG